MTEHHDTPLTPDPAEPREAPPSEPEEGVLRAGASPKLRRAGRTAAVVGIILFLGLLVYLTANYSHGASTPTDEQTDATRPTVPSSPLSAERIEQYARQRLEEGLRAAKPPASPPDLELPGTGGAGERSSESPEHELPRYEPPRPAPSSSSPPQDRLAAIDAPLTPSRGAASANESSRSHDPSARVPNPPRWEDLELPSFSPHLGGAARPDDRPSARGPGGSASSSPATPLQARAPATADQDFSAYHLTARTSKRLPNRLYAGTVVPLVLTHRLATDVAGPVRAVVTRDVYDSPTHRRVLIPRGTLAIGHQTAHAAPGDRRVLIHWRELKLPSGTSFELPTFPAGSGDGTAGARGNVDHHWWSRIGNAVALSLVGAGVQLSQPQERTAVQGFAPDEAQILAQQLGIELGRLSQEILRRGLDRAPTITLRPGQDLTLLLTRDLVFPR